MIAEGCVRLGDKYGPVYMKHFFSFLTIEKGMLKEGNVLFNNTLNTFHLRLYGSDLFNGQINYIDLSLNLPYITISIITMFHLLTIF